MCERGRGRQGGGQTAHKTKRVKEGGPGLLSVVICSSCSHTGGILRLLVSISLSGRVSLIKEERQEEIKLTSLTQLRWKQLYNRTKKHYIMGQLISCLIISHIECS